MKAKAAFWTAILAMAAFARLGAQEQGPRQPGAGATWYLYWMDKDKPGSFAFVTDERLDATDCYVTVWSRVYDPDKGTETRLMELYSAETDSVAPVFLCERNAKNEEIRRVYDRHPEAKMEQVGEPKSRQATLLALIKGPVEMKPKDEITTAFADADKRLRAAAKQKPGGAEPAVWP